MDLSKLTPVAGDGMPARKSSRTTEANPFLEDREGSLMDSYNRKQDFKVTVQGEWEDTVKVRGPQAGEPTRRLTGDAAKVVNMLRAAANTLGIGVAIVVEPAKKGWVTIQYLGKTRKVYTARDDSEDVYEDDETE